MSFVVRTTNADDWADVRALRLEMLADTPNAYGETLDHARTVAEAEWRERGARGATANTAQFVAVDHDARWIGTMGAYVTQRGQAMLVGVYVSPRSRGVATGVTDALLDAVENWCRPRFSTLTLHVHEQNPRARVAYERRGFEYTGARLPYVLNSAETELAMMKRL